MKENKIIVFLLVLIFILSVFFTWQIIKPEKKVNILSTKQIKEKMLSAENLENFTLIQKNDNSTVIKKCKDNIVVTIDPEDGTYSWANKKTKEAIAGNIKNDSYVKIPYVDESFFSNQFLHIKMNLEIYQENLYHIKNEYYRGRECLVIKAGEKNNETYWVDNDTGFVLKYESSSGIKINYVLIINNVTEDDIKKPDNIIKV